jgi:hypothetical protein
MWRIVETVVSLMKIAAEESGLKFERVANISFRRPQNVPEIQMSDEVATYVTSLLAHRCRETKMLKAFLGTDLPWSHHDSMGGSGLYFPLTSD